MSTETLIFPKTVNKEWNIDGPGLSRVPPLGRRPSQGEAGEVFISRSFPHGTYTPSPHLPAEQTEMRCNMKFPAITFLSKLDSVRGLSRKFSCVIEFVEIINPGMRMCCIYNPSEHRGALYVRHSITFA